MSALELRADPICGISPVFILKTVEKAKFFQTLRVALVAKIRTEQRIVRNAPLIFRGQSNFAGSYQFTLTKNTVTTDKIKEAAPRSVVT